MWNPGWPWTLSPSPFPFLISLCPPFLSLMVWILNVSYRLMHLIFLVSSWCYYLKAFGHVSRWQTQCLRGSIDVYRLALSLAWVICFLICQDLSKWHLCLVDLTTDLTFSELWDQRSPSSLELFLFRHLITATRKVIHIENWYWKLGSWLW